MEHRLLAYELIAATLRKAINNGSLPNGAVLLEGPIGALFQSSRSPVKQALSMLEEEGLVRRFDGRGVLAGRNGGPVRAKITKTMLALDDDSRIIQKTFAWQQFYYDFERAIILRAVFGKARINELALARHFKVGRTVAGDILNHAAKTGIVLQDEKLRWWINPLDESRFRHLYELRILLEPAALTSSIGRIPKEILEAVRMRLIQATNNFPNMDSLEFDELEEDLHVKLMQYGTNNEILEALKRTRCVLVAGKHIQKAIRGSMPIDAFMSEHVDILDAISSENLVRAKSALVAHLDASSQKAKERLQAFLTDREVSQLPYVYG